jgi:glycosyltransferase involved in cell wall biosynthesis
MNSEPRVAFVIDSLVPLGGAEKTLFTALEAFPRAEIFTLIYARHIFLQTPIADRKIATSWLDALPLAHTHHRLFLPFMPSAIERFDLRGFDVVVCFSYAVAHGARHCNGARHLSYMYTPMRYAWTGLNLNGTRTRKNLLIDHLLHRFREWDRKAAARVHEFASISHAVSGRIASAYQREARVIYPPVEVDRFRPNPEREGYFITVTRLVPHKRVDLLVHAFNELNLPLFVIGAGSELPRLKAMAKPNIKLLGFQTDETVAELLGKARAFVCAAEEDFGIAIVEAQAAGCPVIAYRAGGAVETVTENVTGLFFEEQTTESLIDAIQRFDGSLKNFSSAPIVQNSQRFNTPRFIREFKEFVGS